METELENLDSPFSQLYLSLQKRILEQVPEIKYVALDIGQLDWYEIRPAVSWPCILIDFTEAAFSNLSQNVQWVDGAVLFRMGFSPFSNANSLVPDISMAKALEFFEIENKVYKALQGWTPVILIDDEPVEIAQPLSRINAVTEKRSDPFRVRKMIMLTGGEDASAQENNEMVNADLNIIPG